MEEIIDDPQYPYTRTLLSALPKVEPESGVERIRPEGNVSSPINPPTSCHFHRRCSEVMVHCREAYLSVTIFPICAPATVIFMLWMIRLSQMSANVLMVLLVRGRLIRS